MKHTSFQQLGHSAVVCVQETGDISETETKSSIQWIFCILSLVRCAMIIVVMVGMQNTPHFSVYSPSLSFYPLYFHLLPIRHRCEIMRNINYVVGQVMCEYNKLCL